MRLSETVKMDYRKEHTHTQIHKKETTHVLYDMSYSFLFVFISLAVVIVVVRAAAAIARYFDYKPDGLIFAFTMNDV